LKQTSLLTLLAWFVSATTGGYLLPQVVINGGGSIPISPWNIIVTLPAIGVVLIAMAIPMFKYRNALRAISKVKAAGGATSFSQRPKRLNPFYAVRLVMLAKAISISGAIFSGWHLGVVWLQLTSPVIPTSTLQNGFGLFGSVVMTVCAIIVERICKITDDLPDANGKLAANGAVGEPA
jgi:hypothetical protein